MLITEKIGHISSFPINGRSCDYLWLEWFEAGKRLLRKKTTAGKDISIRFLGENPQFSIGDVLFTDGDSVVVVDIVETDVIVIYPAGMFEMAALCYEIGNKHLPLFYQGETILVAFENSLFNFLTASGYRLEKAKRKLANPLKTTVSPHNTNSTSLFNRIMNLTSEKK